MLARIASVLYKIARHLGTANAVITSIIITKERKMVMPIIKCQECNLTMRTQVSKEQYVLYCDPCRRAVIVSDWDGDSELVKK